MDDRNDSTYWPRRAPRGDLLPNAPIGTLSSTYTGYTDVPSRDGDSCLLACPKCGREEVHPKVVKVWMRGEDEATPGMAIVSGGSMVPISNEENPSPRREGVIIAFECEAGCLFGLRIWQHKGPTLIEWEA